MRCITVLFVSATGRIKRPFFDPSTRYRCFNLAQELSRRGFRTLCTSQVVFEKSVDDLPIFDIYVFHRPSLTDLFIDAFHRISETSVCVVDFDDLIFDVRHAESTPMVRSRGGSARDARDHLGRVGEAMRLFSKGTFSTEPLAKNALSVAPVLEPLVITNALDRGFQGVATLARAASPNRERSFRYGYFAGTSSHDKDIAMVAPALLEKLAENRRARLLLAGPVVIPESLRDLASQITVRPLVSFHALPRLMAEVQTVIAPLEDTVFNRSKSGLKFFEAAAVGCDVIATPIPDIDRFESRLLHKCRTLDDWQNALSQPPPDQTVIDEEVPDIVALNSIQTRATAWMNAYASLA